MRKLLTLLMVFALAGAAGATTVETWVEAGGGVYQVKARLAHGSLADNAGLALCRVTLTDEGLGLTNTLPQAKVMTNKAGGFVLFMSGEGTNPANPLGGSQDTIGTGSGAAVVYRLGLSSVDLAAVVPGSDNWVPQQVIPRSVVLGQGTYSGTPPAIVDANFTVLNTSFDGDTFMADYTIIPEPATLGLLALGALALIRRRK